MAEIEFRELRCSFIVKRQNKNRQCRMMRTPNQQFCGEHGQYEQSADRKRIRCPLDNAHTCYEDSLQKHLVKCNASHIFREPWYDHNCNRGLVNANAQHEHEKTQVSYSNLQCFAKQEILLVIDKAMKSYDGIQQFFELSIEKHALLESELENPLYGKQRKHLLQLSSLLGHMQKHSMLGYSCSRCYLEFGAGRGKLAYWISRAIHEQFGNRTDELFLLLERTGPRNKAENKAKQMLDDGMDSKKFMRIKCGIEHVNLNKIDVLRELHEYVSVWKHLCGSATDLAFRSIRSFCESQTRKKQMVLCAPCCHHCCNWQDYAGQEFLLSCGFTEAEFDILKALTSWATCGFQRSNDEFAPKSDKEYGISIDQKEEIGRRSKRLIDYGRLLFLKHLGFQTHSCLYVSSAVTPENILLIGICG